MIHLDAGRIVALKHYLVVMSEALVAQDIAQTIREHDAAAVVRCLCDVDTAMSVLAGIDHLTAAFVAAPPAVVAGSGLQTALRDRGGRLILLGLEAETLGPSADFDVLFQPFDTEGLLRLLQSH